MGRETGIAWTDHTANFWMGCQRVSPGCEHCYAEALVTNRMGLRVWGPPSTTARKRSVGVWKDVPKWNAAAHRDGVRRRLFVSSLADVFEDHPALPPWRAEALDLLEACSALDVQLLTKRPENIRRMVPPHWLTKWPSHVWAGCTVEDQKRAYDRIPELLKVPAPVKFLSCEPLVEAVDLDPPLCQYCGGHEDTRAEDGPPWCPECDSEMGQGHWLDPLNDGISWVIVGGESGPGARPFEVAWARSIVEQCRDRYVPCFVKQFGRHPVIADPARAGLPDALWPEAEWPRGTSFGNRTGEPRWNGRVALLRDSHGGDWNEWPADLRVRAFPEVPHV
jgi:protein gp37